MFQKILRIFWRKKILNFLGISSDKFCKKNRIKKNHLFLRIFLFSEASGMYANLSGTAPSCGAIVMKITVFHTKFRKNWITNKDFKIVCPLYAIFFLPNIS